MAPKDYVARGKAKKTPPPKPSFPWARLFITAVIIGGFGYFLYSINGRAPEPSAAAEPNTAPQESQQEDNTPLPAIPAEEWDFFSLLPEQEVQIEQKTATNAKEKRMFLMQCGSFRHEEQAQSMRAQMLLLGFEPQIRLSEGKNGLWRRVILGPYPQKRQAEADRHQLQRNGFNDCAIWYWNL